MLATPDQRNAAFRRSIRANLTYWRNSLQTTPTDTRVADHVWQNVIRAILYACEERSSGVEAAQLAIGLFDLMTHRGAWHEWAPVLHGVVDALVDVPALRSRVLTQVGQCRVLDGHYEASLEVLEEAERLALQSGDEEQIARSHASLCESSYRLHRYAEAERLGRLALEELSRLEETVEVRLIQVAAINTLGGVLGNTGRPDEALLILNQALGLIDASQMPIEASRLCITAVHVLRTAGRAAESLPYLEQSLGHLSTLPHATYDRALLGLHKGSVYFEVGQLLEAEAAFRAIEVGELRRQGYWVLVADTANNLGNVYQQLGRLPEAEAKLIEALGFMRTLEDDVELANTLLTLGEVVEALGRRAEAEPLWREAVERAKIYPTDTRAQRYVAKGRKYLAG